MKLRQTIARRLLDALPAETADPPGVTRAAYGESEQRAHDLVRHEALALGCKARADKVGNLYMTLAGRDPALPCLMLGSHLDSVPHGGNFDGAAGVVAGLAVIADLVERGVQPRQDITVAAFRAEEAVWFPVGYPGSYAALGRLDPLALDAVRSDTGLSLAHHMRAAGFDPDAVRRREPQIDVRRVGCFIEVHIEQGPVLIGEGVPVGIVTAICGGFRHTDARAKGTWAHSGAAPRRHRQDAVAGLMDLGAKLEAAWDRIEAAGRAATITFGKVATDPVMHSGSRVPGEVTFTLDVRSEHADVLDGVRQDLVRICQEIRQSRGVTIELGPEFTWPSAAMSRDLVDRLETAARQAGVPAIRMPSGAGHDTAVFAEAGVPSAMLFVRNANGSHNPDEAMDLADLDRAVEVLLRLVDE